jgi:hypothetical protein
MAIITKFEYFLIRETTEFNLQRFNPDSARSSVHVDDPSLSTDAFDKHQDKIRLAMSRINDILKNIKGTTAYSQLRGKLALEKQDIQNIKILRILKNGISYDVYIKFTVDEEEYWGIIYDIIGINPTFKSELFKDFNLIQPLEWVIKTKGIVIKAIKEWLKPEYGHYRLLNQEVICYSVETGKQLKMNQGIEIELIRAYPDKIVVRYNSETYSLVDDNFVFFNWWFEKID